jgi:two-component system chemotaxis response regulator CheY
MDDFERSTVLLVEPHLLARRILHDILHGMGVSNVVAVDSTDLAYRFITDQHVDAIFLDWSDETDAVALMRRLRSPNCPNPYVPVVIMTGYADREHVRQARDEGANEYLLKPFAPHTVACRLKSVTRHPRMFVQCGSFFGPDRRRHSWVDFAGPERRRSNSYVDRRGRREEFDGKDRRATRTPAFPMGDAEMEGATRH